MALPEKKRRFAEGILNGKNQTQAAKDAGYKGTADALAVTGSRLMDEPEIRAYIEAEQKRLAKKTGMTRERWLKGLIRIAEADMSKLAKWGKGTVYIVPSEELPRGTGRLVREVSETPDPNGGTPSVRVKLRNDSIKAYELIGKAMGYSSPEEAPNKGVESIKVTIEDYTDDE